MNLKFGEYLKNMGLKLLLPKHTLFSYESTYFL